MQATRGGEGFSPFTALKALRRRKFYFLIPVALLMAGCAILATRIPKRYRAQVLIAANSLTPRDYLKDRPEAAMANVQDQMTKIRETLYGRPVLETLIREFDLAGNRSPEQAIEAVKSRITVQIDAPDTFNV